MTRKIYIIAGEPSGDLLGARLMKALKNQSDEPVEFVGIGGPNMIDAGLTSLFDMGELSIMGLSEILPHIPKLLKRIDQTIADVKAQKPEALITIDAPGFTFRVAKKLKGQGFPLIHYVAPTVWAWKPKRAQKIAKFLDHLMVLLPFEPPYFEKHGLATTFVGHSVIESDLSKADGHAFRQRHGIPETAPILCLLPGSRRSETTQLLPVFKETVVSLKKTFPDLRLVLPTVSTVSQMVREETLNWGVPVLVVEGDSEKYGAFKAAKAALAASGTVSLELALAGTPSVITYRLKKLTHWIAKRLIKVKYASIINLLHKKEVTPELIQDNCTADKIIPKLTDLLKGETDQDQLKAYAEAMRMLGSQSELKPSEKAAACVLNVIDHT